MLRWQKLLMLDPVSVAKAPRLLPLLPGAAAIFPDAAEATALTGFVDTEEAATSLLRNGVERVVVTLGEQGVLIADPAGIVRRAPASHGPIADVTGAGDAMVAGYLARWRAMNRIPVGWGLAAASLAVETLETVPLDLDVSRLLARLPLRRLPVAGRPSPVASRRSPVDGRRSDSPDGSWRIANCELREVADGRRPTPAPRTPQALPGLRSRRGWLLLLLRRSGALPFRPSCLRWCMEPRSPRALGRGRDGARSRLGSVS